jgi:hypothetical protein
MATPDDRLARLLKRAAAQTPFQPIPPLAAARADDVVRAWRAATPASAEGPLLWLAWRGALAATAVMLATCALYISTPDSATVASANAIGTTEPELAIAENATLLALQP